VLLGHLAARLGAEYGMAAAVQRAKVLYSRVAEPAIIEELAARCDFVVAALGD
jgi:hypothetical protein